MVILWGIKFTLKSLFGENILDFSICAHIFEIWEHSVKVNIYVTVLCFCLYIQIILINYKNNDVQLNGIFQILTQNKTINCNKLLFT